MLSICKFIYEVTKPDSTTYEFGVYAETLEEANYLIKEMMKRGLVNIVRFDYKTIVKDKNNYFLNKYMLQNERMKEIGNCYD